MPVMWQPRYVVANTCTSVVSTDHRVLAREVRACVMNNEVAVIGVYALTHTVYVIDPVIVEVDVCSGVRPHLHFDDAGRPIGGRQLGLSVVKKVEHGIAVSKCLMQAINSVRVHEKNTDDHRTTEEYSYAARAHASAEAQARFSDPVACLIERGNEPEDSIVLD